MTRGLINENKFLGFFYIINSCAYDKNRPQNRYLSPEINVRATIYDMITYEGFVFAQVKVSDNKFQLTLIYVYCITITTLNFGTFLSEFFCKPTRNLENDKINPHQQGPHYFYKILKTLPN